MIVVLDAQAASVALDRGRLSCPACGGVLRRWGHARSRRLGQLVSGRVAGVLELRPQRARCGDCRATQVLLPAVSPPRGAYAIEVVGAALLAAGTGAGPRAVAERLGVPADTVRGWLRRAAVRAEWLRDRANRIAHACDADFVATTPAGGALPDALNALGAATGAVITRLGLIAPPWHIAAMIARGRLLASAPAG